MDLLRVAKQAALDAGKLLCEGYGKSHQVHAKAGLHDIVTEYDKSSEDCIIATILKEFPDHAILAEESGSKPNSSSVTWVIDPLDGTVNFSRNIPVFSISIAACIGSEVVCGIVYQPIANELFIAEKGKGAFLNGSRLKVSSRSTFDKAVLATGFPYNVDEDPMHCIETFAEMTRLGVPIRRLGSAAIDLAYVAAGRYDAYWEVSLHPWDMAAGKLLVEEAGGKVTHYDGTPHGVFCHKTILASNGSLHPLMMEMITP